MPFLEITLPCREADHARVEHALEDVGAISVTMMDAHAEEPEQLVRDVRAFFRTLRR